MDQHISKFYAEHRLALYRHLLLLGLVPAEAQEVAQEAFRALYRVLRDGEKVENWRTWLYRAARNSVSNREKPPVDGEGLFRAIAELPLQQRECLQLRAAGFGNREIAQIMEVKSAAVGDLLRRAIAHLRKAGL